MYSRTAVIPFVVATLLLSLVETKFYRPLQFQQYKSGPAPHHDQGNPTSRHKNHCAYVVEKTVSFTVQDGAAPYVKAEYNKCSWGQKCPTLMYRLMYKPMYKVAHKSVTELEWRCCPGFSGYGCMEGHPVYQHPMRMMPPFKGPPMKGPVFKGPAFKGPPVKADPWSHSKGPAAGGFHPYPAHRFGPPRSSHYPDASFESYPSEPEPMPEHEESQGPEELLPEEVPPPPPPPPPGGEQPQEEGMVQALDGETEERLYQMEEDVRRLSQGLETLRGTVNGLEDSLRASLREDANRMLSALLNAAPGPGQGPGPVPAPALASSPSAVGFVEIPGGDPEKEGLDGRRVLPGLTELNGRVEELRTQLQAKTAELQELKAAVKGHDGALKKISVASDAAGDPVEDAGKLVDAKLGEARAEILGGLEKRVESAERRCEEKAGNERRRCQREEGERREEMEGAAEARTAKMKADLRSFQAQMDAAKAAESCCSSVGGLAERVELLEASVAGLNRSQGHLRVELGGHRDHVEGMLEGRLAYVEAKLNGSGRSHECGTGGGGGGGVPDGSGTGRALEARMDGKLRAVEGRLLAALEELGNASAPALLEGHAVPTLETELESLRGRLEMDVDRVQKHLSGLEVLCSSSCATTRKSAVQGDAADELDAKGALEAQRDRLDRLNDTMRSIAKRLSLRERQDQAKRDAPLQGELTVIRFNVRSVNDTLTGLRDSLGTVVQQVGQANSSWHEREARLAQQIRGVVQLVGHQASMLGAGERRLTRLKAELQEMRRRLAEEVRGCRSTALVVKKEVSEVGGRVASVEDRCKGLGDLAEDLERIREELERQSSGLLLRVNGTLTSHAQQLSELKGELRNCTRAETPPPPPPSSETKTEEEEEDTRGDTFALD